MSQEETTALEGHIAIRAAIESRSREIFRVMIDQTRPDKRGGMANLARFVKRFRIPVDMVQPEVIAEHVTGQTHGGVIALCGPRKMVELDDLMPAAGMAPFIAMIDGVEDPFNFGQAVRALYAAGCDGLVLRPRNWMSAAGTVARASAGATERIPTAVAETALDAADFFRARGLTIATTAKKESVSLYKADLTKSLFLLIGGEKRGVTRSFLKQADLIIEIPYARSYAQSLGTTAATSILAFEVMRQRQS